MNNPNFAYINNIYNNFSDNQTEPSQRVQIEAPSSIGSQYLLYSSNNNFPITNFCCSMSCLLPLTPKDIKTHIKYHNKHGFSPEIETIDDAISICRSKLQTSKDQMLTEQTKLNDTVNQTKPQKGEAILQKLNQTKEKLYQIIESYFQKLCDQVRSAYSTYIADKEISKVYDSINQDLLDNLKIINDFELALIDGEKCINTMQKIYPMDFEKDISNISKQIENLLNSIYKKHVDVTIDDKILNNLQADLNKFINLTIDLNIPNAQNGQNKSIPNQNHNDKSGLLEPYSANLINASREENDRSLLSMKNPLNKHKERRENSRDSLVGLNTKRSNSVQRRDNVINTKDSKTQNSMIDDKKSSSFIFEFNFDNSQDMVSVPKDILPKNELKTPAKVQNGIHELSYSNSHLKGNKHEKSSLPPTPLIHKSKVGSTIPNKSFEVEISSYFVQTCTNKYLHFFQDNSKKLHLLDISDLQSLNNPIFEEIDLQINFRIPLWHRSIITPEGQIFLTGGTAASIKQENNLNRVYQYDYETKSLNEKPSMKFARNSHAICVFQGAIYVIGGCLDEGGYTKECEKYEYKFVSNKSKGGWESIASLNYPAFAACVANFNNKFLFKFGGILDLNNPNNFIEKYDPGLNHWEEIKFNIYTGESNMTKVMAYAACIQINQNEIYIFGGTEDEPRTHSTYKFKLEGKEFSLERINVTLPHYGTFWNNAIINDNKILCLQNIQLNKSDTFHLGKRRILCYDKETWEILGNSNAQYKDIYDFLTPNKCTIIEFKFMVSFSPFNNQVKDLY